MLLGISAATLYTRIFAEKWTLEDFHITEDVVYRAYRKFVEEGEVGFLGPDGRKGTAHKISGERRERIQAKLDKGMSVNRAAKEEGITESALRQAIKQGYLKKREIAEQH